MIKLLENAIEKVRLVREGLDQLDRGEFASEAEIRAVFDKYRA